MKEEIINEWEKWRKWWEEIIEILVRNMWRNDIISIR